MSASRFTLTLFLSLWPCLGSAASELFFPLEKNNIQALPLRFEYQLVDKDNFRLGDVMLNADQFKFELIKSSPRSRSYRAIFQFPSSIIESGELAIKDSGGKAIFSQRFSSQQLRIKKSQDQNLRNSTATIELPLNVTELVQKLRFYAFFKLCVAREEKFTKVYLCSKELFIKSDKDQLSVHSRDSLRPESFVEINGRTVGNQGVIFLNDPQETLSLRTLLLSGASFEIETKMKRVDFADVTMSEDNSKLIVRANGANPVNEDLIKRLGPDAWSVEISPERPYLYLRAEGDIPMRQEFIITGKVRTDSLRIGVLGEAPTSTFSSTATLRLKPSLPSQLLATDGKTEVQKYGDSEAIWKLLDLEVRRPNRRFLSVQTEQGKFVAAYDITRLPSNEIHLLSGYPFWAELIARKTFSEQWNFYLDSKTLLVKEKTVSPIHHVSLGFGRKWGDARLELGFSQTTLGEIKSTGPTAKLTYSKTFFKPVAGLIDEAECQLAAPFGLNNGGTNSYDLSAALYSNLNSVLSIESRLVYRNWNFQLEEGSNTYSKALLNLGLRWFF